MNKIRSRILLQVGGIVVAALVLWLVGLEPFRSGESLRQAPMPGISAPTVHLTPTVMVSVPPSPTPAATSSLLPAPSSLVPAGQGETEAPTDGSVAEPSAENLDLSPDSAQEVASRVPLEAPLAAQQDTSKAGEDSHLSPDPCTDSASETASLCVDDQAPEGAVAQAPDGSGGEALPGASLGALPGGKPQDLSVGGGVVGEVTPFDSPLGQPLAGDGSAGRQSSVVTPFDSPLAQPSAGTEVPATPATEGDWVWPVRGIISQGYSSTHRAIDIDAAQGSIVEAADVGRVVYARWESSGYGYLVIVDHDNGYVSYYAHLYGFYVDVGQTLVRGQQIGELGNTGDSTGPHLHFEIRYDGVQRDPLDLLPEI